MFKKISTLMLVLVVVVAFGSIACSNDKTETEVKVASNEVQAPANEMKAADGGPAEDLIAMAPPAADEIEIYNIEKISARTDKTIFPEFTWTQDGKKVKFSEYAKNKVVFLNFWTTWCGPCKKEIPDIIAMTKELEGKDVVIIGISVDRRGDKNQLFNKVKKFVNAKKINYITFHAPELAQAVGGVNVVPTTLILTKEHKLAETITGGRSKSEFMKAIERAM
jgi:thiol-disulfide isomerase/thioredoxin